MTVSIYDIFRHKPDRFFNRTQFLDQARECLNNEDFLPIYQQEIQESEERQDGILAWAMRNGYPIDILDKLVSLGCGLDTPSTVPVGRWGEEVTYPIHEATDDVEVFTWLMDKGPTQLEVTNKDGLTPLGAIFKSGAYTKARATVRDALLAAGANPNTTVTEDTSREEAAALSQMGIHPFHKQEKPLLLASTLYYEHDVVALANAGADLSVVTRLNQSLLHVNAEVGSLVDRVVASGIDPNGRDVWWNTPLHAQAKLSICAPQGMSSQVIEKLVSLGAELEARNGLGQTPLHLVHSLEAAETLLRLGADLNARDKYGTTAKESLTETLKMDSHLAELLEKYATPDDGLVQRLERAMASGHIKKIQACFELGGSKLAQQIQDGAVESIEYLPPEKALGVYKVLAEHLFVGDVTLANRQLAVQIGRCQAPGTPQFITELGSGPRPYFEAIHPEHPIFGTALNFSNARRGKGPDWRAENLRAMLKMGCSVNSVDGGRAPTLELRKLYWEHATPAVREELRRFRGYEALSSAPPKKASSRLNPTMR